MLARCPAAARWELSNGGMYMGFGVGATVVGRRAGGLILDDVVAALLAVTACSGPGSADDPAPAATPSSSASIATTRCGD